MKNEALHTRINESGRRRMQARCDHVHTRVTWSASHLSKAGFGGYYEVGIFDTDVRCKACEAAVGGSVETLPLCQACLKPMQLINSRNDQLQAAMLRFKAKQKRDWQKHCARMEHIEAEEERRRPPPKPGMSFYESLRRVQADTQDSMIRILRGSSRQQVWPYRCTNCDCTRFDRIKFLHTPGD